MEELFSAAGLAPGLRGTKQNHTHPTQRTPVAFTGLLFGTVGYDSCSHCSRENTAAVSAAQNAFIGMQLHYTTHV